MARDLAQLVAPLRGAVVPLEDGEGAAAACKRVVTLRGPSGRRHEQRRQAHDGRVDAVLRDEVEAPGGAVLAAAAAGRRGDDCEDEQAARPRRLLAARAHKARTDDEEGAGADALRGSRALQAGRQWAGTGCVERCQF